MKASHSQEKKHGHNAQRKAPLAKQATIATSDRTRNAKLKSTNQAARTKSQYLTVKGGKIESPQRSAKKKKSASKSRANQSQHHYTRDTDTQYEQVTQNLRESLNFFMSQDPSASTKEAADLDNTAATGDLNQTHLTYQSNTGSVINIKDQSNEYDLSQRGASGDRSSTLVKQQ